MEVMMRKTIATPRVFKQLVLGACSAVTIGATLSCQSPTTSDGTSSPEVTLNVHHFLPPSSTTQTQLLEPWAEKIEADSEGRIQVEIYPAMQLGGKPPQLFDQVRDGVVDVAWTLTGYTPGRFPTVEVFELPFIAASAEATSLALQEFYELHLQEEFQEVHPLVFHVHAPGSFHMQGTAIQSLADLEGVQVRAPTRVSNRALELLGATPVGMPVPEVPEALSKGVIDGALLPYEVAEPLRIHELTDSHTEIKGDRGLYTAVFLLAMNLQTYNSLPQDLKAIVDANSGIALAQTVGRAWDQAEQQGRQAAEALGNAFYAVEGGELERWQTATAPAIAAWVETMNQQGKDGQALLEEAQTLIQNYADQSQ